MTAIPTNVMYVTRSFHLSDCSAITVVERVMDFVLIARDHSLTNMLATKQVFFLMSFFPSFAKTQ